MGSTAGALRLAGSCRPNLSPRWPSRGEALLLLLILPGAALVVWVAGVLFTTDLALPVCDVRRFKNVLVVFPHADDETLNCGGAIRRFSTAGATVTLLLLTSGERGNPLGAADPALKAIRRREAEQVAGILGVSRLIQEDFGDGQLRDRIDDVTSYLSRAIPQIGPDLILTHDLAGLDGHPDHVACSEMLTGLRRTHFQDLPIWCVALPRRVLRLLKLVGQLANDASVDERRAIPTHRLFIGTGVVPKIRSWYAYRSQRGSLGKGLGKFLPTWIALSMLQFEYFAESA
jgi:LmbE family N-acetylglucosaminyl deacetylase